jgi:hypothetical protein
MLNELAGAELHGSLERALRRYARQSSYRPPGRGA